MNPNTIYNETKIITLTSNTASRYKNGILLSHLVYDFAGLLKDEPDILHRSITIRNAQIPVSFYVINEYNNVLNYSINDVLGTITVPYGNYNANTFLTQLNTLFLDNGVTATSSINKLTGRVTITISGEIIFFSTSTILKIMGFLPNETTFGINSITAPYPLNLLGIKQLQIRCPTLNLSNYTSGRSQTTVLTTIPVDAVSWGMISYTDSGNTNISFSNATLDELELEIVDAETQNYVDFNNVNWTMTFSITLMRKLIEKPNTDLSSILSVLGKTVDEPKTDTTASKLDTTQPSVEQTTEPIELEKPPELTDTDMADLLFLSS